jgi:hypothetical protein
MGIELVPEGYPRGRPRKYDEGTVRQVRELIMRGVPAKEISSRMGIPLRTVYYFIEQAEKKFGTRRT